MSFNCVSKMQLHSSKRLFWDDKLTLTLYYRVQYALKNEK